jgi:3D (Asp-Asp-Asp) domain-containing protein
LRWAFWLAVLGVWAACAGTGRQEYSRVVVATAYNSLPGQTSGDPSLAAWGDRLEPGMKAIAVSPDLIALGLGRGTRVRIEGLSGEYVVLDRMPSRWKGRIDLYMGEDVEAAREWGRRSVRIHWSAPR